MKMSLFYKSYSHDFEWLKYSAESVSKFGKGVFDEIVLVLPEGEHFDWPEAKIHHIREIQPTYLFQMVTKCHADYFCSGDVVVFGDSDTIFKRPVTREDFIRDGKPVWLYSPFADARDDQQNAWYKPIRDFIGTDPYAETMRAHCFTWPREFFDRLRSFCKFRHRKELSDYVMSLGDPAHPLALAWSEFNCGGAFAWEYEQEMFSWFRDDDPNGPSRYTYQGFSHGGEERKQQDIAKFREILEPVTSVPREAVNVVEGEPRQRDSVVPVHATHSLTESSAIEFLASQVRDNPHKARIIRSLKTAWKGKGVRHEKKPVSFPAKDRGFLLCIHSYPGANETMARHWPCFKKAGATRIAGVGTTDGKCTWPDGLDAVVDIGENAYMRFKGKDDHLCRRLIDTVKWCLTQPEDRFAIVEYDTLILKAFPQFSGVHAHLTGGQVNGSKTKTFHHNPWLFDRDSGPALVEALQAALPDSAEYPNNSPDLFFGLATERAQIEVKCCFKLFTRNSLDVPGNLKLAVEAALDGANAIHGVKKEHEYQEIMNALKLQESKAA